MRGLTKRILPLAALVLCLASPAWAQEEAAITAEEGNTITVTPNEAFNLMAGNALHGDAQAMLNLGRFYEQGIGVARNYSKALEWYVKASEQGLAEASYFAGASYEIGQGDQADLIKAADYFEKSAQEGLPEGMYKIATIYLNGEGRSQDTAKAFSWMRNAALAGHGIASNAMGVIYINGSLGQDKDEAQAMEWFMRGADAGNLEAIKNIAVLYKDGIGVEPDPALALQWYYIAQKGGFQAADMDSIMEDLKSGLSQEQVESAEQNADAWLAAYLARTQS